jgi:hypothetical protein
MRVLRKGMMRDFQGLFDCERKAVEGPPSLGSYGGTGYRSPKRKRLRRPLET